MQRDPDATTPPAPWSGRPWARSEPAADAQSADADAPESALPRIEDLREMAADLDDIDDILQRLDDDPDGSTIEGGHPTPASAPSVPPPA